MAVLDDLKGMAAEDVVYLTRNYQSPTSPVKGAPEVYRGRLRQASDGGWVFSTFTGQNGVVGILLGLVSDGSWVSAQTPSGGTTVTIEREILQYMDLNNPAPPASLVEKMVLSEVIPSAFVE